MRPTLAIILILAILPSLSEGKTEALIHLDKERVSVGDFILVSVHVKFENPSPVEILISGRNEALWLCKNESEVFSVIDGCGNTSWRVKIPESWESGDYFVKVNVHEGSTLEFSKAFRVVRPKITEIKVPELVYNGKKEVVVKAEVAEASKAKIHFRLFGLNSRLDFQGSFDRDGVAKFYVDLRDQRDEPLKPGYYVAELKLFYDEKLYDSRSITVEIVKPKLEVSFNEEIKAGETLRLEISTNRDGDAEYDGIFVVLAGKNLREVRYVKLNKDGKARVAFETAGLDEGYYTLYVRDTSLTLRNIDFRNFSKYHYALSPSDSSAKLFYAHDDVLVFKTLKIVKEKASRPTVFLVFEPLEKDLSCEGVAELEVFLLNLPTGLSGYELRFSVSNSSVARIGGISTPDWANEVYKVVFNETAKLKALDIGNKVREAEKLLIARLKLFGISEGSTEVNADVVQLSDDEGNFLVAVARSAVVSVKCGAEQIVENETVDSNRSSELVENSSDRSNPRVFQQTEDLTKEIPKELGSKKFPRPKKLEMSSEDAILLFASFLAFAATFLGRRLNSGSTS